jgi:hypothetical protein
VKVLLIIALASSLSMGPAAARQQSICNEPVPPGFRPLDQFSWEGPWVFAGVGPASTALPAVDNSNGQLVNGPMRIRLDDGSDGALRVESRPCGPLEDCAPYDCGCPLDRDSYWIVVADARGRDVARMHLWAAYGKFQIVPIDLVDGVGDELVVVRVPNHASPPIGYDMKIWKPGVAKPIEIGGIERVANLLGTKPIGCARWRTFMSIDRSAAKPRSIALRTDFGATACCGIAPEEADSIADMRRAHRLRFDSASGKYIVQ